ALHDPEHPRPALGRLHRLRHLAAGVAERRTCEPTPGPKPRGRWFERSPLAGTRSRLVARAAGRRLLARRLPTVPAGAVTAARRRFGRSRARTKARDLDLV